MKLQTMPLPLEAMSTRKRRPNWTDQECIFLAQLMEERKVVIRGKCSSGVSTQDKRQAWEEIAQAINAVFPQIQRTVSDCSKKWENLLAKAREEIKRQKMQLGEDAELSLEQFSHITQIVISVMNSDRLLQDRKDPSIMHMMDSQSFDEDEDDDDDDENSRSTSEPSAVVHSVLTDNGHPACSASPAMHSAHFSEPSTSPPTTHNRFAFSEASSSAAVNFAMPCTAIPTMSGPHLASSHCSSTPSQERLDLEMSVLRRQEAVLKLQEEYYTLKIKLMKEEMAEPTRKRLK